MTFKIMYKFVDDEQTHTCYVTYDQYQNFKKISAIEECDILKENQENFEEYQKEMQTAIDLAVKNDTSHVLKLSK